MYWLACHFHVDEVLSYHINYIGCPQSAAVYKMDLGRKHAPSWNAWNCR